MLSSRTQTADDIRGVFRTKLDGEGVTAGIERAHLDPKISVATARSFLQEKLHSSLLGRAGREPSIAGRAEAIREGLRERVGDHADAAQAAKRLAQKVEDAFAAALPR